VDFEWRWSLNTGGQLFTVVVVAWKICNSVLIVIVHNAYAASPLVTSVFSTPPYVLNSFTLSIPVLYSGVALTCLAANFRSLDYSLQWYKRTRPGQEQVSSASEVTGSFMTAKLIFENGFQLSDIGEYGCSMQNNTMPTSFTIKPGRPLFDVPPCSLYSTSNPITFRIRILDTRCDEWSEVEVKLAKIQYLQSVTSVVSYQCPSCSITNHSLTLAADNSCRDGALVFTGLIGGQLDNRHNHVIISCLLKAWKQQGSTITVDNKLHHVDSDCALTVGASRCGGYSSSSLTAGAVYSYIGTFFLAVLGVLAATVVVLILRRK
jgi:hypothetical protein